MKPFRVLQISDRIALGDEALFARLAHAPRPAELAVQLRDPGLNGRELLDLGLRLREATRRIGAGLVVNDRLDVAAHLGADGVHLGRGSVAPVDARRLLGPDAWISLSCHDLREVAAAAEAGVQAAVLSPVFATPGKGTPLGVAALAEARRLIGDRSLRLVALGGIDAESAPACFAAGADAVASIRADLTGV